MELKIKHKDNYYTVLVDDEDTDLINAYRWHLSQKKNNLYLTTKVYVEANGKQKRKTAYYARLVLGIVRREEWVDHINRNTLDNRKANLRVCTAKENSRNRSLPKTNTTGAKGVRKITDNSYRALIKVNQKSIHLGMFKTKEEASEAYDKAAVIYFGEYACLNR